MKHGMKIALASAASLAVLAGCEGTTDLSDASTISRTSTAASTYETHEPEYVAPEKPELQTQGPMSDAEVSVAAMETTLLSQGINLPPGLAAEYADAVCTDIGNGVDPMNIAMTAHKHLPMYDIMEHAMMVGASVGSHCEEYGYIIDSMGQ